MAIVKVAFLVANGVEESEFVVTHDILNRAGIDTIVYNESEDENFKTNKGLRIRAHGSLQSLIDVVNQEPSLYDALIIPGGPGHELVDQNKLTDTILELFYNNKKIIAAICAAPSVVGKRGYLDGKKATCYPGFEKHLKGAKVDLTKKAIIDGLFITGRDYMSSYDFGFAIVEKLLGKEKAKQLKDKA